MAIKGAQQVLVETFVGDVAVTQYAAVVQGTDDYHCTLPAGQNATGFLGAAWDSNVEAGSSVPVVMIGTAWMVASGAIAAGDQVIIANAQGQVEPASAVAAGTANVIGTALSTTAAAGDIVLVMLSV